MSTTTFKILDRLALTFFNTMAVAVVLAIGSAGLG